MNRSEFADACAETGHGTALDFELLTLLLLHWGRTDARVLGVLVSGTPGKAGNKRRIFRGGRAALRPARKPRATNATAQAQHDLAQLPASQFFSHRVHNFRNSQNGAAFHVVMLRGGWTWDRKTTGAEQPIVSIWHSD
jgi:hypothetical protein